MPAGLRDVRSGLYSTPIPQELVSMPENSLELHPLSPHTVHPLSAWRWFMAGWKCYRSLPLASSVYAAIYTVFGLTSGLFVWYVEALPMLFPLAMSFLLVGPIAATGFYQLSRTHRESGVPSLASAVRAWFGHASLWILAILSGFLWLIWITDAAILYGLYFGGSVDPGFLPRFGFTDTLPAFGVFASLMWLALGLIIFGVNAFSVPLLFEDRVSLPLAIGCSVRGILRNPVAMFGWAGLVVVVVLVSLAFPPLFLVALPVLAYGSEACYREVYSEE
ncbi:Hypothetical protein HDN1F_20380 [gamma proteobacterium HdN1]|nr:Hypothetical protein HDN1F_20380 [gamma proteobacterium HdN1]